VVEGGAGAGNGLLPMVQQTKGKGSEFSDGFVGGPHFAETIGEPSVQFGDEFRIPGGGFIAYEGGFVDAVVETSDGQEVVFAAGMDGDGVGHLGGFHQVGHVVATVVIDHHGLGSRVE